MDAYRISPSNELGTISMIWDEGKGAAAIADAAL
jgi:hypothetical protein